MLSLLLLSDLTWDDLEAHADLAVETASRLGFAGEGPAAYEAVLAACTLVCQPRDGRLVVIMPDRVLREALDRRLRELNPDASMSEAMFAKCLADLAAAGMVRRPGGKSDPLRGCLELLYDVEVGDVFEGLRFGVVPA